MLACPLECPGSDWLEGAGWWAHWTPGELSQVQPGHVVFASKKGLYLHLIEESLHFDRLTGQDSARALGFFEGFNAINKNYHNDNPFLNALASLVLMFETHSQTYQMKIDGPIPPQFSSLKLRHQHVTQNGMSLKMECQSKWNVTQNVMSLRIEYQSKWIVTQNGNSLKWKVPKNGMSLKMECLSTWNVIQNWIHS